MIKLSKTSDNLELFLLKYLFLNLKKIILLLFDYLSAILRLIKISINKFCFAVMFSTNEQLEKRTPKGGIKREDYINLLASEFYETANAGK